MAHIELPAGLPGIRGLLTCSPDTARPIGELAEYLLRGANTLTRAEREMIATFVSRRNECHYRVRENFETAGVSPKTKALLGSEAGRMTSELGYVNRDDSRPVGE